LFDRVGGGSPGLLAGSLQGLSRWLDCWVHHVAASSIGLSVHSALDRSNMSRLWKHRSLSLMLLIRFVGCVATVDDFTF
jgi:hypothetical protein